MIAFNLIIGDANRGDAPIPDGFVPFVVGGGVSAFAVLVLTPLTLLILPNPWVARISRNRLLPMILFAAAIVLISTHGLLPEGSTACATIGYVCVIASALTMRWTAPPSGIEARSASSPPEKW